MTKENLIFQPKGMVRVRLGYYLLPFCSWDGNLLSSIYIYNDKIKFNAPPFYKELNYQQINYVTIKRGMKPGILKSMGFGYSFFYQIQIHHSTSKVKFIFVSLKEQEEYKQLLQLLKKNGVKVVEEK